MACAGGFRRPQESACRPSRRENKRAAEQEAQRRQEDFSTAVLHEWRVLQTTNPLLKPASGDSPEAKAWNDRLKEIETGLAGIEMAGVEDRTAAQWAVMAAVAPEQARSLEWYGKHVETLDKQIADLKKEVAELSGSSPGVGEGTRKDGPRQSQKDDGEGNFLESIMAKDWS